jgi:hypothetical protein
MSDIKFACPSCGQKIKCDSSHAGLRIPCPGCGGELEIPKEESVARQSEPAPTTSLPTSGAAQSTPTRAPAREVQRKATSPKAAPKRSESAVSSEAARDVRCLCPVCRSELRVRPPSKKGIPTGTLPMAELVRPGNLERFGSAAPRADRDSVKAEPAAEVSVTPKSSQSAKAAERPAPSPVGSKPRLSYVLTGKPPAPLPRPDGAPRRKKKAKAASGGPAQAMKPGASDTTPPADT